MPDIPPEWTDPDRTPLDFIIVGAGAGGAPLAARLAERGYTVLVTEMGPKQPPKAPDTFVENTDVPLLHPEVTEDPRHALRFFVKHFDTDPGASLDPKQYPPPGATISPPAVNPEDEHGIFYPRAQGVGGCTVHNAMITVSGPSEDWDQVAEATGDESWRGERMRAYFERVEQCHYNKPSSLRWLLKKLFRVPTGWEDARHGTRGWLHTTVADLGLLFRDRRLLFVVARAAFGALWAGVETLRNLLRWGWLTDKSFPNLDPNHWRRMREGGEGLLRIPCAIAPDGTRSDPRARLFDVTHHAQHRTRLNLLTGVCVTGIEFRNDAPAAFVGGIKTELRAIGVRCLPQEHVYEADPNARVVAGWEDQQIKLFCKKEVLLCGGAFNTPQLLMLSGIGPKKHLGEMGIDVRVDAPGVGENLQDRYEVPVVATVTGAFESLTGLGTTSHGKVAENDPVLKQWRDNPRQPSAARGIYATNGGLIGLLKRSNQEDSVPDLFIFALAGYFPGYHVGYSKPAAFVRQLTYAQAATTLPPAAQEAQNATAAAAPKRTVTWLILKSRTRQHGGAVRLRSKSPFRRPEINFRSFPLGRADKDALAIENGIDFIESFLRTGVRKGTVESFECPGLNLPPFSGDRNKWVRSIAWGHHACGTCRIGSDADADAVLDSRFRVRGVQGLRVVDASVFPHIPGVFIVTNVYMVAEKAADVLTEDHPIPPSRLPAECAAALRCAPVMRSRAAYEARRVYPTELEAVEAALVWQRREQAHRHPAATKPQPAEAPK
ncbi:MAG TPA: GMC oxidoreductase [Gemmata sp.]